MNILIISNLYPPHILGGYEILCAQVVTYLKARGHHVHVLCSDHGGSPSDAEVSRTLKVYQDFDKPALFQRRDRMRAARHNSRATRALLKEREPEVVFIWSLLRLTPASARVVQRKGLPTVFTFNDENIMSFAFHTLSFSPKAAAHWLLDMLCPSITLRGIDFGLTTCISKILKNNLLARGLPIQESRVIYQGIPLEKFPVKEYIGERNEVAKLLYVGQIHPYKGVHTILEALKILERESPDLLCSLTIVGKGEESYTQKLKSLASHLSQKVEFKGLVPHEALPALYRESDLFVFPSIWEEPFGLTHLEAMASGLPVISTANGGQGEFLLDGENALTFPPDNPGSLAAQLGRILRDDHLFRSLAIQGRQTAVSRFGFARYVDELEALLGEAAPPTQS
ncbi:MAG: glycosyltransferase family 4 protein [Sphaerochaeta sp.]|nr:glycosyltransferase family 4 protein [Sphaerochaeta sp.]